MAIVEIGTTSAAHDQRLKIAWLSPFPPHRTGVANYSSCLVQQLNNFFDIDLYYEGEAPSSELQSQFATQPVSSFADRRRDYDRIVYHLGNNHHYHTAIYTLAWDYPGIVVLHDYDLSGFMHEAFLKTNDDLYFAALPNGHSGIGRRGFDALMRKVMARGHRDPMSHAIVNRSEMVIVHHRWVRDQFQDPSHIKVIPHFAKLNCAPTQAEVKAFRRKFGIKDGHFVLACLGFVNPNKLPQLQIEVVKRLLAEGYPVQLIFAGEPAPELGGLVNDVRAGELRENIIVTGYQNEVDYFCAIAVADVIINLRSPSMGEASGTLMHALAAAKPTIVSDVNQYRELPDKVCWKLVHDHTENDLLLEYLKTLLAEPAVRAAISKNAADYVKNVLALEKVREYWIRALTF